MNKARPISPRFEFFESNSADEIEAAVAASVSAEPDRQIVVIWQAPDVADIAQSHWLRSTHLRAVVLCMPSHRQNGTIRKTALLAKQIAVMAAGAKVLVLVGARDIGGFLERTTKPGDMTMTFGDWDLIDSVAGFSLKY